VTQVLDSFPKQTECIPLLRYLEELQQACASVWHEQCATRLPRERLDALATDAYAGHAATELIHTVWK
jgi:hypothetical protein